jgi:hypothetical protein
MATPSLEYARVARDILPAEVPDSAQGNSVVANIQSLYLTAVQAANREPDTRVVDALAEPPGASLAD